MGPPFSGFGPVQGLVGDGKMNSSRKQLTPGITPSRNFRLYSVANPLLVATLPSWMTSARHPFLCNTMSPIIGFSILPPSSTYSILSWPLLAFHPEIVRRLSS